MPFYGTSGQEARDLAAALARVSLLEQELAQRQHENLLLRQRVKSQKAIILSQRRTVWALTDQVQRATA